MKRLLAIALLISVGLVLACQDELDPPTTGSIALVIDFSPAAASAVGLEVDTVGGTVRLSVVTGPAFEVAGFTSVTARAEGPTTRSVTLQLVEGFWEGEITALQPGSYTVTVEAFVDGELDARGVTSGVEVRAGVAATANVSAPQGGFRPTLGSLPGPSLDTRVPVSFSAVSGADNYRIEWSKNSDFSGARTQTTTETSATVTAADSGTHYVRVRALAGSTTGTPSTSGQFVILADQNPTGPDPGSAAGLGFGASANQTIGSLNIVPAADEDWFAFTACQDDRVEIETIAAALTPASGLNTRLQLFNNAATTVVRENDDRDVSTTDSYIDHTLTASDTYRLQVTGVGNTTGPYELRLTVTTGPLNNGTDCALPQPDTVIIEPASVDFNALGDTVRLSAVALDASGDTIQGQTFTWNSDDPSVASVDPATGLVTAETNGSATITATAITPTSADDETADDRAAPDEGGETDSTTTPGRKRPARGGATDTVRPQSSATNVGSAPVTVQQAPAAVVVTPPQATITFLGGTVQYAAEVQDPLGSAIAGATVGWSSGDPGIASIDTLGVATGVAVGSVNITATSDTVSGTVPLEILQEPAALPKAGGDNQVGFTGRTLAESLAVRVDDAGGSPIPGVPVTWAVTAGGGSLSTASGVTDGDGIARVAWTLGGTAGVNSASATVGATSTTFNALAVTGVEWTSAVSGNWSDGTKWSTGSPPTSTDPVLIGLPGDYTVTLDVAPTVPFLEVGSEGGGVQTLATSGFDVTVNGILALSGQGVLNLSGGSSVVADTMFIGGAGIAGSDGSLDATFISNTSFIDGFAPGISITVVNEFVNGGKLEVFANGFTGITGGTFTETPSGLTLVGVDATLDLTAPSATFAGDLTVDTAGTLNLSGVTGSVAGTVTVGINAAIDLGASSLTFGSMVNNGAFFMNNSSATGPIANNGTIGAFTGLNAIDGTITTSVSSGIEVADGGTELSLSTGLTNNGSISFFGAPGGNVPRLTIGGVLINSTSGSIDFADLAAELAADSVDNAGSIFISIPGCCAEVVAPLASSGTVLIDDGWLSAVGSVTTSGEFTVERSTSRVVLRSDVLFVNNGFFQGGGTVDVTDVGATFTNAGAIGVGPSYSASLSVMTFDGDLALTPGSTVEFELGGTTPGVDMDQLVVSGNLAFDGAISAFTGAPLNYGDSHLIIQYGSRTGAFSDTTSLDQGQYYLRPEYTATDLTLTWSVPQVVVTPAAATLTQLGTTQQFAAEARESDNTPIPGITFTWNSSDSAVATVDGTGLATAAGTGSATITAVAQGGTSGAADITVTAPGVKSVTLTPAGAAVTGIGTIQAFGAEVLDSNDAVVQVPLTWTSLNSAVATVDAMGNATAAGAGQVVIQAETDGGVVGYATLTVAVPGGVPVNLWAVDSTGSQGLNAVWGTDGANIYAGGNGAAMVRFDGVAWNPEAIPISNVVTDIWGTSPSDIIATSGGGSVLRWDGSSWGFLSGNPSTTLNGIWAATPRDRWIVGADGTIAYHDGTGWTTQSSGTMESLNAIWGTSVNDVFVVGGAGTILHSSDGLNWAPQASGVTVDLTDIWGTSPTDIFAVGDSGTVVRYNGSVWTPFAPLSSRPLTSVWGSADDDVYASRSVSAAMHRFNGSAWNVSGLPEAPFGLWGAPQSPMFAVGTVGTILRGYRGASVTIAPAATTLTAIGDTVTLAVAATDAGGNPVSGLTVNWMSLDPGVADVDPVSGLVTAQGTGTASITATAPGGAADTAVVTVAALFVQVVTGGGHTCGLTITGEAFCWGLNDRGQLGRTTVSFSDSVPGRVVGGHVFTSLTAGDLHTCGIDNDDDAWCWGHNGFGSLGNNSTTDSDVPVLVQGGIKWATLSAGGASVNGIHTCGVAIDDGTPPVYCWGSNSRGQLGIGSVGGTSLTPAQVLGTGTLAVLDLSAGGLHSCMVVDPALGPPQVQCWGENFNGQLGDGTTTSRDAPVSLVAGSPDFSAVDAGFAHTCALEDGTGAAYCWGSNDRGQLGNGNLAVTTDSVPSAVVTVPPLVTIAAGGRADVIADHSCGNDASGNTYCWGADTRGQLGNGGGNNDTATPSQITSPRLLSVDAGGFHTCGRDANQKLWCWGANQWGQIGSNNTVDQTTPFLVLDP